MNTILLSINPEHLAKIFDGTKTYEFRKARCNRKVSRIVFYCTAPVMKIVGEAEVSEIIEDHPDRLWEITSAGAGISKTFFDGYYSGRSKGVAFGLMNVTRFESERELSDYGISAAPQSFRYI